MYVFHFLICCISLFSLFFSYSFGGAHPTALDGSSRATDGTAARSFPRDPEKFDFDSRPIGSFRMPSAFLVFGILYS